MLWSVAMSCAGVQGWVQGRRIFFGGLGEWCREGLPRDVAFMHVTLLYMLHL